MDRISMALLRGVCQLPAYIAKDRGFFAAHDVDVRIHIQPTAWTVPDRLDRGELEFAVIPWTRVAAANVDEHRLVLVCGSGCEEAAIVVRRGLTPEQVRTIAVPQQGGMKELTASAFMDLLDWTDREILRFPSGDGAILALIGEAADAASMVEPYATMLEALGIGTVVRRTGDVWRGAPGCSLATSTELLADSPDLVRRVVAAFVQGARFIDADPDAAAAIGARYIGVHARFVRRALDANRPDVRALANQAAIDAVLQRMLDLGYVTRLPRRFADLRHLDAALLRNTP